MIGVGPAPQVPTALGFYLKNSGLIFYLMEEIPVDNVFWQNARDFFPIVCEKYGTSRVGLLLSVLDISNLSIEDQCFAFERIFPLTEEEEDLQMKVIDRMDSVWRMLFPEEAKQADDSIQKAIDNIINQNK